MNQFIIVLAIIVLSRGWLEMNEQFLVGISFVRFVRRRGLYRGEGVRERLNAKRNELLKNQEGYYEKKRRMKRDFFAVLKVRRERSGHLKVFLFEIKRRRERGFRNVRRRRESNIVEMMRNELRAIAELERILIPNWSERMNEGNEGLTGSWQTTAMRRLGDVEEREEYIGEEEEMNGEWERIEDMESENEMEAELRNERIDECDWLEEGMPEEIQEGWMEIGEVSRQEEEETEDEV